MTKSVARRKKAVLQRVWILLPVCASLSVPVQSAEKEGTTKEEAVTLEPITVTATPLEQEELHIAQPVEVLKGEKLRRRQALTIGETLAREPGITGSDFGLGASRPIIRGLGGSRVRLLEGGIGSLDLSYLSPDHAVTIDPFQASQIEVLKGPATLLYGSGAIGGIVNVVTNRIPTQVPEKPTARADFRFNSATLERTGGGALEAGFGPLALHFDGIKTRTSDYTIPGFASLPPSPGESPGTVPNSDTDTENIAGGASYVGEKGYLGTAVAHFGTNYGIPPSGEESGTRIDLDQLRYDIALELQNPFPGAERLKARLGHVDYKHQEIEGSGEVATTFLNNAYEGRLELLHNPLLDFRGALGVQVLHQDTSAQGEETLTPPVVGRSVGTFLVEERDLERWHFELGTRFENTDYTPEIEDLARNFNVYSISGGTTWSFAEGYSAGLSLTRSQQAPTIDALYNFGPHLATLTFEVGNPELQKETANSLDLTFRKLKGRWSWRLNPFFTYYEDFIFAQNVVADGQPVIVDIEGNPDPEGGLQLINFVQDNALFYGAELEGVYGLLQDGRYGGLDARLFADYVRGKLTSGENLPRMTPPRFGGGLDYRFRAWQGYLEVMRVNAQTNTAPGETETAGYTMFDAGVSYTLGTKPGIFVLSLRGTNLLDEEARRATSFLKDAAPLPGRSVMVTFQASF